MRSIICGLLVLGLLSASPVSARPWQEAEEDSLAKYYGFSGLEIFKLARRSANMTKGDFNGDGLVDVLVVDNSHSRLDLLQQRKDGKEEKPSRVNDIKSDWRFEHVKIPVDRSVGAMTIGDFNNDGNTDIATLESPDRLVVRYQSEEKKSDWTKQFTVRLPGAVPSSYMVAAGDLNNDKRDDIVALGKSKTYILYQNDEGEFDTPTSFMNTSGGLALIQVADINGDGLHDLTYLATEGNTRGLCARLQQDEGVLGPELRFDLNRPRSVTLYNIDDTPETEILTIDIRTGRVAISRMKAPEAKPGELPSRLTQYGFGEEGSGKGRDLTIGDVNGDGKHDVVMTDPEKAQMLVYRQTKQGLRQQTYPGLLGANHVRVADLDGDKSGEVFVMSNKEKVLAVSKFADGRLTFPRTLPLGEGVEPICFDVADVNGDGQAEVVYIATKKVGRKSSTVIGAVVKSGEAWKPVAIGKENHSEIDLPGKPADLKSLDANNDGKTDLLVFFELNKPPALLLNNDGVMTPLKSGGGIQLGKMGAGNVTLSGSKDASELLISQESFARRLRLEDNQWQVKDQYNAAEAKAEVGGSAELNLDGEEGNEIVLIDTGVSKLRVLRKEDNLFKPWREVELGSLEFKSSQVADMNGDGKDDLLLVGKSRFAVLYAEQAAPTLEEVASFETKLEKVFFSDLVAGDINADGRPDIAAIDTRSHYVELLNFDSENGLRHAMQFKVFEEKGFSADRNAGGLEPREGMIADVTGDGRSDLLLLVHDRVLLYPQDSGESPIVPAKDETVEAAAGAN